MITGAHVLIYTTDADADRQFLRDVLELRSVDAGHGWLIFGLPPAEVALHPGDGQFVDRLGDEAVLGSVLYLMCDDVEATVRSLEAKGAACTPRRQERWGIRTTITLPSGGALGLYQPLHPTAIAS
jgi:catechol 2,3-dioxygenase-like lactoylglutathione lyase family enzyme